MSNTNKLSKETAERWVFSQNAQQSQLLNTSGRYLIAVITLLSSLGILAFGFTQQDYFNEILGVTQAVIGLAGIIFAIWASETRDHAIQNTFLFSFGTLLEIAGLVNGLAILAVRIHKYGLPETFYLIPYLVFLLSFFISYAVVHKTSGNGGSKRTKTVSLSGSFVFIVIAIVGAKTIKIVTNNFGLDALKGHSAGLSIIGAAVILNFILGLLAAIYFYRNLLVKKFDIDLSPLYDGGNYPDGYHINKKK
ncbi:MAG: hypothetical protein LBS33_04540 [Streptococcaceae bacterium]|jgi:hypothetical protein|nr:hypothetical protein [Streptococcaceae bacterium]